MVDNFLSFAQSEPRSCALCTTPARYKCPRCATPTCSLPCSRRHKRDSKCTGERDKAEYVPMNAYGWSTLMQDYCYLEDVGRKVSEWGSEIVRSGYMGYNDAKQRAGTRKNSSKKRTAAGKSKRDMLREHLETLGIDVELLPTGMERRNLSQSTFNRKSKCCLLTIEFIFYPPTTFLCTSTSPYKMLAHHNSLSITLLTVLQRHASLLFKSQRKDNDLDWVLSMVVPHPEAPECFNPPHCYIRANSEFPLASNAACYHQLDSTLSLGELLQGTSFTEFPTIHVFDPDATSFRGTVVDKSGSVVRTQDNSINAPRIAKRRKLDEKMGLKTVFSLVGGYGSEGSSHSEEDQKNNHATGLATLEAYSGSDDEETETLTDPEAEDQLLHSDDDNNYDRPAESNQLDPAKLIEAVKQAQHAANEDGLDWGDEWDNNFEY